MRLENCILTALCLAGCKPAEPIDDVHAVAADIANGAPAKVFAEPLFVDVAADTGLVFEHFAGISGRYYFPEIMGAGCALADFDGDGDLDVYAVQGRMLDHAQPESQARIPAPDGYVPGGRLYRNELETGTLRFVDVTDDSGLNTGVENYAYDMGASVGDVDGDGDPDLYVTSFGPNRLYLNDGAARFVDISISAGVADAGWGTSAAFFDYDRDGDLDLYVANYVAFAVTSNKRCVSAGGQQDYCDPLSYAAAPDRLFRNDSVDGQVRFTDVTASAGIAEAMGSGLGVTSADFNGDRWPDIYVANDKRANLLWTNQRDGTFSEGALMSGAAYNVDGIAEASMGVTAGDYDSDGDEDLFITHLSGQTNTLYRNDGTGNFLDVTDRIGLGASSLKYTGFGSAWFDYNNDGEQDLFIANGAVLIQDTQAASDGFPYRQRNQLFRGTGNSGFIEVGDANTEAALNKEAVGRGAAFGDIDNDGDVDILVSNNSGPLRLLRNETGNQNGWLRLELVGAAPGVHAVGARVGLLRKNRSTRWRRVHTDGSYLTASDSRVQFGLGNDSGPFDIAVQWPSGADEIWRGIRVNTFARLVEGQGESN